MVFLITVLCSLPFVLFFAWSSKYRNPYKMILYIGLPGSGKTTELTKQSILSQSGTWLQRLLKLKPRFQTVYANMYIPNTIQYKTEKLGTFMPKPNSLFICDEAGIYFDNRNFKNFNNAVRDFLKYHRQYKVKMIFASQSTDVDKKIRDLCDEIWIMRSFCNVFVMKRRVKKIICVSSNSVNSDENTINLGGDIVDKYKYVGLPRFTFIPRYVEFFKSYNPPLLAQLQMEMSKYNDVQLQMLTFWSYVKRHTLLFLDKVFHKIKVRVGGILNVTKS